MIQRIKKHGRLIGIISAILVLAGLAMAFIPQSVFATDYTISIDTVWDDAADVPGDIGGLTINSGVTLTVGGGAYDSGGFTVTGTGTLTVNGTISVNGEISGSTGYGIVFNFADVNVASGGAINGDGKGFASQAGTGAGTGNNNGCSGASHGGRGGSGYYTSVTTYGSEINPVTLGSGGGNGSFSIAGGAGAGAVKIIATSSVAVSGTISVNGQNGSGGGACGGSGGSVYITAATISGAGTITATGGDADGEASTNAAGGGGRIAVLYSSSNSFTGANATANNATVGVDSENGTVIFVNSSNKDAYIYKHFMFNASAGVAADLSQASNGVYYFNNLTVSDNAVIILRSKNTSSSPNGAGATINLSGAFNLGTGAVMSGSGEGYIYQVGPGAGAGDNNGASGAGYGGSGGNANNGGWVGGSPYGSASAPMDIGSGGGQGAWSIAGGAGGGAIKIDASGNMVINGTISNSGSAGPGEHSGGGSGGSIYLLTGGGFSGSGAISANGGNAEASGAYGGGGGGGRTAIVYTTANTYSGTAAVNGGTGYGGGSNGSAGTSNTYAQAVSAPVSVDGQAVAGSPTGASIDPVFIVTPTEILSNNLQAKIQIATDSSFTQNVQTFDQTSSQTGWSGQNADSNTTYTTGSNATYTVQTSLTPKTTYYWRSAAIAPAGLNSWGAWSATYSFITNAKPQITSLTASQSSTGAVNISYTLSDEDDSLATISFQYWDSANYQEATTATGEGSKTSGTSPGTAQTGAWTAKTDYNNQYTASMKIRVSADDGNTGGTNSAESAVFTFDTANPSIASFSIAAGAVYTNSASVALSLSASDDSSLEMQFSNDNSTWGTITDTSGSVTDSGSYETYATSKTGWYLTAGDDGTRTVYLRIKDAKGNTATSSDTISLNLVNPTTPTGFELIDVSTSAGPYRHFLSWDANADGDFSSYVVQRKVDVGAYGDLATISTQATDYYLDDGLSSSSTYYYKIKVQDVGSNTATSSEVSNQPYSADTTAPSVSDTPSAGSITTQTATISWTTNETSNSIVDYGADTNYGFSAGDSAESVTSHSVSLVGLTPGASYYFRVKSTDAAGNTGSKDNSGAGYTFTASAAPVISSVSAGAPGQTSATITWTTSTASDSLVEWGTSASPDATWKTSGNRSESVTSHSVSLTGLTQATTYYFQIKSRDSEGNQTTDNNGGSYYSFNTASDSIAPIISTGPTASNILNNSAVITWKTNEASTTQLAYSTASGFGWGDGTASTLQSEKDYNHTVSLTGLTRNTAYYVLVRSLDASNNPVISSQISFTTTGDETAPVISLVSAGSITETSAIISWTTDEPATSQVFYSTSSVGLDQSTALDTKLNRTHRVTLSNLAPAASYYFQVVSQDANSNSASLSHSQNNSLTFTALTTPAVSSISVGAATASTQPIAWISNVLADSFVEFGTAAGSLTRSQGNHQDSVTSHSVTLSGLSADTAYYFRIKSTDSHGNTAYSSVSNFTTAADSGDLTAPSIAGDSPTVSVEARSAVISWTTDEVSNSIIRFGATSALGSEAGKDDAVTSHSVSLTGLTPSTVYHYEIRSKDASGNIGILADLTLTTKAEGAIADMEISDLTLTSAIVSWTTNIVTTSTFNYGTDKTMTASITDQSLGATTTHTIRLKDLGSGAKYYFQVSGSDEDGNPVQSDQYTFSTLPLPQVTEVKLGEVLARSAEVIWQTNVPTTSLVSFGAFLPNQDQGSSDKLTSHKVTLQALSPATGYKYQIKSTDQYGNTALSDVYTLTTKSDVYPPQISQVKSEISTVGSGEGSRAQAIITWLTDEPATSQVKYGVGITSGDFSQKSPTDESFNQSHVKVIRNLESSTTYRFRVVSRDEVGNESQSTDYTILTPEKEASTLQIIIKLLEDTFSFIPSVFK